jgi:hypothetical protein
VKYKTQNPKPKTKKILPVPYCCLLAACQLAKNQKQKPKTKNFLVLVLQLFGSRKATTPKCNAKLKNKSY